MTGFDVGLTNEDVALIAAGLEVGLLTGVFRAMGKEEQARELKEQFRELDALAKATEKWGDRR